MFLSELVAYGSPVCEPHELHFCRHDVEAY